MLFSFALILILGFSLSGIFQKFNIPGLFGMILTGILLGPFVLNLIDESILNISSELRQIALIVILLRAGLSIDFKDLKKVGTSAFLMSFVPATLEILAIAILGPMIFSISLKEALILGAVLAAVSPAVIVPKMLQLISEKRGTKKSLPQLIMAAASVDDIYVIILFTSFLALYEKNTWSLWALGALPLSILSGAALGFLCGRMLTLLFQKVHMRDTIKVLLLLSMAFLLVSLETFLKGHFPFSGLIGVMMMGGALAQFYPQLSQRIMGKFSKIWVASEILLFVLVGCAVNIHYLTGYFLPSILLITLGLCFRICGVYLSILKNPFTLKERLFCACAYLPKATVQAAIGAIPLQQGIASGDIILSVSVTAILWTAPMGAWLIDKTAQYLTRDS